MKLSVRHLFDCQAFGSLGLRPRTYLLLGFTLWGMLAVFLRESTSWAEDDETAPEVLAVNQQALSNEDIAQNEERLKRLEEELLKTLDASSKSSANENPRNPSLATVKISDIKKPGRIDPEQAPRELTSTTLSQDKAVESSPPRSLKELEDHPVLQASNRRLSTKTKRSIPEQDADLSHRLSIAESQVEILSRELDITRKRLRSAENAPGRESSVEDLPASGSTRARTKTPVDQSVRIDPSDDNEWVTLTSASASVPYSPDLHEAARIGTMGRLNSSTLASIAVDSAPLRIGPGARESALFVMPRHSQVRIEHRTGEWYRVITHAGARGWLWSGALVFDAGVPPTSTVRVGGFRSKNEPVSLRY